MDAWEYGIATVDPQKDQIQSTQGPLPQVNGDEMENDLMNYLLRVGSVGWELIAVVPIGDTARLFFKKRRLDEE
jgi:hypothetical protein